MKQQITELQEQLTQHFAKIIKNKTLAHAYLFNGDSGVGKLDLAVWIAQGVFCENLNSDGTPCLKCNSCLRIAENEHPDVIQIIPEGKSIKVDEIRFLKSEFAKSGVESNRKIFIIKDADKMTVNAANSLLKFIEEPFGEVTAFLLTSHINQILPTIVSRCQVVEFKQRQLKMVYDQLIEQQIDTSVACVLAHLNADIATLVELGNDEHFLKFLKEFESWFKLVLENDPQAFVMVQTRLMLLLDERQFQEYTLELINLANRDLLLGRYQQNEQIAFKKQQDQWKKLSQNMSSMQLVSGIQRALQCQDQWNANMAFQNILEALTLSLYEIYHKR